MKSLARFALAAQAPDTLRVTVQGVKVSFLAYSYPVLFPMAAFQGVNVADPRDIAGMKLGAVASRGTKRDFVDLYALAKLYGLAQLLEWFKQRYAELNRNLVHGLKSLTYFEDADKEPMPDMLIPLSWEDAKRYFRSEVLLPDFHAVRSYLSRICLNTSTTAMASNPIATRQRNKGVTKLCKRLKPRFGEKKRNPTATSSASTARPVRTSTRRLINPPF
jgi:hypothetical protein